MWKLNVNKLFPRLPIRVKLLIAFAGLVVVPLLVTAAFGTRETLRQIEASARLALDHELETASDRTEHFLMADEEDVIYLAEGVVRPAMERGDSLEPALIEFLRRKPKFYQVRLFTADGDPLAIAPSRSLERATGGAYYAYRAADLRPGQNALLAVEILDTRADRDGVATVPAFAVVHPLRGSDGRVEAIVVGEVRAAQLFEALQVGSPRLGGSTGLVDADGQYLYHSERKRDWNTLLAARPDVNLSTELGPEVARRVLTGESGVFRVTGHWLVASRPLRHKGPDGRPLRVYRAVPVDAIATAARRFLGFVGVGGFLILGAAMAAAVVAATQFTRPIYRLREEARRVAAGGRGERPQINTNDELEDLADDFAEMADRLHEHRRHLEEEVAARTAELRTANAELEEILSHTDEAILRLDGEGKVRVWNRGAEAMFGWRREETIGHPFGELLGISTASDCVPEGRIVLLTREGEPVEVGITRSEIQGNGGAVLGYTVVIRDETRARALERQMLRSERLAAAGRLAAGVVHEINNPIGIIVNRIDCMDLEIDERCGECAVRDDLAVIRHQAERVGAVTRRLLAWAREESEAREPVDVNGLVEGVVAFLGPEARKRDLRLGTDLEPALPAVMASPQGIESILLNLALNAVDASRLGDSVTIATRPARGGSAIEVEVTDTGIGIPSTDLERVFEPFFTTKIKPRGTGLGLAVCQSVAQAHNGEIRVASEPGAGSRFTVLLPLDGEGER